MRNNEYLMMLADLIRSKQWDDAYVFFSENKHHFSKAEQKRLMTILLRQNTASAHNKQTLLLFVFTVIFQLFSARFFQNQIQDLFSFVAEYFRPYMYVSSFLLLIIGIVFDIVLFRMFYIDFIWKKRLLSQPILLRQVVGALAVFAFLMGFSIYQTIPLLLDLPAVVNGNYAVGIITKEQHEATIIGNAYVKMGKEPIIEDYDPIEWVSAPKWSDALEPYMPGKYNRWLYELSVNGEIYQIGKLQFDTTDYLVDSFPVKIEYLPNSRLILWISYGVG